MANFSTAAVRSLLDHNAGQLNARGDAQFPEGLTEVMGNGVGADVHASCDLVVVQSLGDKAGDGLLGAGQAAPAHNRPGAGTYTPMAPQDAQLAEPPADARRIPAGAHTPVLYECRCQAIDGLIPVTSPFLQDAKVLRRRRPGPRVCVLCRGAGQDGRITMDQAQGMCSGRGRRPELRVSGRHRRDSIGSSSGQLLVSAASAARASHAASAGSPSRGPGWPARSA